MKTLRQLLEANGKSEKEERDERNDSAYKRANRADDFDYISRRKHDRREKAFAKKYLTYRPQKLLGQRGGKKRVAESQELDESAGHRARLEANSAKRQGNMYGYHRGMERHHEIMGGAEESNSRYGSYQDSQRGKMRASKHYAKADEHRAARKELAYPSVKTESREQAQAEDSVRRRSVRKLFKAVHRRPRAKSTVK